MMFGVIIGQVVSAFVPIDSELALGFTASEPVESHFCGFETFHYDCVVDVTIGCGVVRL